MTSDAVIQTHQLTMRCGKQVALAPLDLSIPRVSVYALAGHNGAGKTTLLKLLLNVLHHIGLCDIARNRFHEVHQRDVHARGLRGRGAGDAGVDAHLTPSLAAEEITPGEWQTTAIRDRFAIPGGGSCDATKPPYDSRLATTSVVCRFAYSVPYPVEIDATMEPGCPGPKVPMQVPTYDGGTGFDPLRHWPIRSGLAHLPGAGSNCIVQSLTTTVYRPVTRFRTSLDIPAIRLADYLGH